MGRLSDDHSGPRQAAIDTINKLTKYGQLVIQWLIKSFTAMTGLPTETIINLISELGLRSDTFRKDGLELIISFVNQGQVSFRVL
jgi:hypothetical protein